MEANGTSAPDELSYTETSTNVVKVMPVGAAELAFRMEEPLEGSVEPFQTYAIPVPNLI